MSRKRTIEWFVEQKQVIIAPGNVFPLSWDDLVTMWPDNQCYLVALTERQLNVIHSALSLAYYHKSFWGLPHRSAWQQSDVDRWDTIHAFVAGLENCLMDGCNVSDLIAAIDAQTAALTAGLNAVNVLALDTIRDTLSNWQVQDGSDQTIRNTELSDMATEMAIQSSLDTNRNDRLGDINTSTGIIGDRIAPNGKDLHTPTALIGPAIDTIPPAIDALTSAFIECCKKQKMFPPPNELPSISFGGTDQEKCDFSARFVGAMYQFMKDVRYYGPIPVGSYAFALGILATVGIAIKIVTASLAEQVAKQITTISWSEYLDAVSVFGGALDEYHQAIYEAVTPQDAQDAIYAVSETLTFINDDSKGMANLIMGNLSGLTRVFEKDDYYFQYDYGDWYTGDCSEYTVPAYAGEAPSEACPPYPNGPRASDVGVFAGSPTAIFETDGSIKPANVIQTFSSQFDSIQHNITIAFIGKYDISVVNVSRSVNVILQTCVPNPPATCYSSNTTADGLPSTYRSRTIHLFSSDGSFTADLEFNQRAVTITTGC